MTQQALRELVAKWRRELREVDSDRDNYSPPSADYFASELESLLGEQREAQGAADAWKVFSIGGKPQLCFTEEEAQTICKNIRAYRVGGESARPFAIPLYSKSFSDNGDEIEARLKYDSEHACPACGGSGHKDDVAPPLAESVGDELNPKALEALKSYQQADRDGIMVNVSRQALDEAIAILERRHMQQGK